MQGLNHALRQVPTGVIWAAGALPALWLLTAALGDQLGADPIEALEHGTGLWALRFLLASLAITPLLRLARLNLLRFRRALGVWAFLYAALHFLIWMGLDHGWDGARLVEEILRRPYIMAGLLAGVILLPLALTSFDRAVRWMGAGRWRRLHKGSYGAALLAALHFILLSKGWSPEPLLYLAITGGLLWLRRPGAVRGPFGANRSSSR